MASYHFEKKWHTLPKSMIKSLSRCRIEPIGLGNFQYYLKRCLPISLSHVVLFDLSFWNVGWFRLFKLRSHRSGFHRRLKRLSHSSHADSNFNRFIAYKDLRSILLNWIVWQIYNNMHSRSLMTLGLRSRLRHILQNADGRRHRRGAMAPKRFQSAAVIWGMRNLSAVSTYSLFMRIYVNISLSSLSSYLS